ncbi:MAG: N-6 DNA methylase, partial [Chitinophagales bacterium]
MISKHTFKKLLQHLNFEEKGDLFYKNFGDNEAYLKVDFKTEKIIYPEDKGLKVNRTDTCNFRANENFVVFECVYQLLNKGYKPSHIVLEPTWRTGTARADVLVYNQKREAHLLIECKTSGAEFTRAWGKMLQNGGQLFDYARQEGNVKFLCLYASNLGKAKINRKNYIITLADNQSQVELDEHKDVKRLFYKDAQDVKQLFAVWKETYKYDYKEIGIFEDDIEAYNIGKEKLNLKDLKYITGREMQTKFHEFAEVLRRYSVSNKEAAFDKLINLFLCKIVDETQSHRNGKALDFYWRGEYADDYFSLMDRLQKLYKEGMETFLGEKITFIDNQQVIDGFCYFKQDKNATKEYILKLFKQQKYFTNSDFSFIEVHNEKLFEENAKILLDIVKMWQYYQLNGEQENQFLSDMFEFFLAKGFKQSEGQFFTPIPICRFILHSLPVKNKIAESTKTPKVLDYACGAGHFLTEYASLAKRYVGLSDEKSLKAYYQNVFGVEKEYRLSKVAKISAFMYGQDEINVVYCDALGKMQQDISGRSVGIEEETVDIIVANPPFSVEGFLKNLPQSVRQTYSLLDTVSDEGKNRNIQCFFIERAIQMLKDGGVAGIIVPSSVLSNSDTTHLATRKLILKHFDIVSIVELGGKTFGQTGTNTVVLFLRKKIETVKQAAQYAYRIQDFYRDWLTEKETQGGTYQDVILVKKYCQHIEIPFEVYEKLFTVTAANFNDLEPLLQYDTFKDYKADFDKSTTTKNLKKKKYFKALPKLEQTELLNKHFIAHLKAIEEDKLYYFILAYNNPQKTLIVKSPKKNAEQKRFLGYEWSGSKGNEGIKYRGGEVVNHIITPMFDPLNPENTTKINYFIQQNFNDTPIEDLPNYCSYVAVADMLDFSRKDFNKVFSLSPKVKMTIDTKWDLVRLSELALINPSKSEIRELDGNTFVSFVEMASVSDEGFIASKVDKKLADLKGGSYTYFAENDIIFAKITPCMENGKCAIAEGLTNGIGLGSSEFHVIRTNENLNHKYLFNFLNRKVVRKFAEMEMTGASGHRRVPVSFYETFKVPLPPIDIQQQIVNECEVIDKAVQMAKKEVALGKREIEDKMSRVQGDLLKLVDCTTKIGSGATPKGGEYAYKNEGVTLIRSQNVYDGRFEDKGLAFIDEVQASKLDNVNIEEGDVLFNITGAS